MTLVNLALWLILIALLGIVPLGCFVQARAHREQAKAAGTVVSSIASPTASQTASHG